MSQVKVPDVRGLNIIRAQTLITDRGLFLGQVKIEKHTWPKDMVIDQLPFPGRLVSRESNVSLTVSDGNG